MRRRDEERERSLISFDGEDNNNTKKKKDTFFFCDTQIRAKGTTTRHGWDEIFYLFLSLSLSL